jgi:hypothetical protein
MALLGIFLAGYASVFLLGFQSRNVNHGNYGWAAGTSFCIGLAQASIWSKITAPGAGWIEAAVYGVSGMAGIVSSMWVHQRFIARKATA